MSDWTTRFESPETADAELEAYIARKKEREAKARQAQQTDRATHAPIKHEPEPKKQGELW